MDKEKLKGAVETFWQDEKTFLEVLPILATSGLRRAIGKIRSPEASAELFGLESISQPEGGEDIDTTLPAAA